MCIDVSVVVCFHFMGIFPVEWLCHMVTRCLTFWQTARLFSRVAALFTFPLPVYESFSFFKSLQLLLLSVFFFYYSHPSWSNIWLLSIWLPRWSSSVILICISLITNYFEHLFVLSDILICFFKKYVFKSLPIFSFFYSQMLYPFALSPNLWAFLTWVVLTWVVRVLYIFWIPNLFF